jgi:DNA-binding PadR family transcriptional regulator
MGRAAKGSDGFGREVVLGLLAEEPSNCYQLDRRLGERFGSAGYAYGTARQAIRRLVDEGLVSVADVERRVASGAARVASTTYEVTPAGAEHFRGWMWRSVSTPPVREELHAKIALCCPADLERMVEVVREAETVCIGRLNGLNFRVSSRRHGMDPEDWQARMDLVVSTGDQAWWDSRIKWLQKVRVYLEAECKRYQQERVAQTVMRRIG